MLSASAESTTYLNFEGRLDSKLGASEMEYQALRTPEGGGGTIGDTKERIERDSKERIE